LVGISADFVFLAGHRGGSVCYADRIEFPRANEACISKYTSSRVFGLFVVFDSDVPRHGNAQLYGRAHRAIHHHMREPCVIEIVFSDTNLDVNEAHSWLHHIHMVFCDTQLRSDI
jgi:hypothetical protein